MPKIDMFKITYNKYALTHYQKLKILKISIEYTIIDIHLINSLLIILRMFNKYFVI